MDWETEQKVEAWKAAKASKDFATADEIRAELRAAGYDPDKPGRGSRGSSGVDAKIQQWQQAKADKDFQTADAIRAELREQGVDPDPSSKGYTGGANQQFVSSAAWTSPMMNPFTGALAARPVPGPMSMASASSMPYDSQVEHELDQWSEARRNKDYQTADRLREGLRARGVSPQKERPGGVQDEIEQWKRARNAKDFERSDRIRASLREQGIEPDKMSSSPAPMAFAYQSMVQAPVFQAVPNPTRGPVHSRATSLPSLDSASRKEVKQWYEAKEAKDYATADAIRGRLRQKGIEPDQVERPGASPSMDSKDAKELEKWFDAKEQKNYPVADSIRERLRAKGIDPQKCQRPVSSLGGGFGKAPSSQGARASPYSAKASGFDSWTESRLDEWYMHKQDKNFGMADAIRGELREMGIEPDQYRPRR